MIDPLQIVSLVMMMMMMRMLRMTMMMRMMRMMRDPCCSDSWVPPSSAYPAQKIEPFRTEYFFKPFKDQGNI